MQQMSLINSFKQSNTFNEICALLECSNNKPGWPDEFGKSISQYLKSINAKKIRTLSLFSGAGGLDIGFSDAGFEIIESIEIESKFCKTLEINSGEGKQFKNTKVNCIDIRNFSSSHLGRIDFIIGGPPCQTFSAAGRRANGVLGTTDARGVLFREYVRLLQELLPVGFLFENVYGIVGAQGGKPWQEILESFSKIGYKLNYRIIDAADYGTPQHRERLFIVGLKEGVFKFPRPTHGPDSLDGHPYYDAQTAISGLSLAADEKLGVGGRYGALLNDIPPGLNYSFYTEEMGHPNPIFAWRSKFSDFLYKADPNLPVRTIKASGGAYTGPFHWENRFFSYNEYKRLQSFPDSYAISGSKQDSIKQIGNSVPPQLARILAIAIQTQIFKTRFPFELSTLENNEELSFRKRKRQLTELYRKKALQAISNIKTEKKVIPLSREYFCVMESNFDYKEVPQDNADYKISVNWNSTLNIKILQNNNKQCKNNVLIEIYPRYEDWPLNINCVKIEATSNKHHIFTIAWKAFERELVTNNIKADLVQLNGYYQYTPKLRCQCILSKTFPYRHIIENIVSGKNINQIIPEKYLCILWGISNEKIIEVAEFLRTLGYEIRNHKTNPQIEQGCWLIPYAFPTLTPLSVQLRKQV